MVRATPSTEHETCGHTPNIGDDLRSVRKEGKTKKKPRKIRDGNNIIQAWRGQKRRCERQRSQKKDFKILKLICSGLWLATLIRVQLLYSCPLYLLILYTPVSTSLLSSPHEVLHLASRELL